MCVCVCVFAVCVCVRGVAGRCCPPPLLFAVPCRWVCFSDPPPSLCSALSPPHPQQQQQMDIWFLYDAMRQRDIQPVSSSQNNAAQQQTGLPCTRVKPFM